MKTYNSRRPRGFRELNPEFFTRCEPRRRGGLLAGLRAALGWLRTAFAARGMS
jgi:hypothetical protein